MHILLNNIQTYENRITRGKTETDDQCTQEKRNLCYYALQILEDGYTLKMYYCPIFLTIYFEIKVKVHFSHQGLCFGGKNGL